MGAVTTLTVSIEKKVSCVHVAHSLYHLRALSFLILPVLLISSYQCARATRIQKIFSPNYQCFLSTYKINRKEV
jgi:hypothetical protein